MMQMPMPLAAPGPLNVAPRSAKEREAMAYRRGGPAPGNLSVANPDGGQGSGVLQHMDGGRLDATPEDEEPSEVPPRYDTIPHDR